MTKNGRWVCAPVARMVGTLNKRDFLTSYFMMEFTSDGQIQIMIWFKSWLNHT